MVLALLLRGSYASLSDPSGQLWEETPTVQQFPGYHPMIRFSSWDITRFNRSTTYMFLTPDLVQQGQYTVSGSDYYFRAVMANELENADKAKLVAEIGPEVGGGFNDAYARSMQNFRGSYDQSSRALYISYPVKGVLTNFTLYLTTDGDDQLQSAVSGDERGMVGLWHAPNPYPDKLDARTRSKIDDRGLRPFFNEAASCDGAQFSLLDLRADKSFRIHGTVGTWQKSGSTLTLIANGKPIQFGISGDGTKLLQGGKPAYIR
jgi:hypothetical protein